MQFKDTSIETARALDVRDELRSYRERFLIDDPDTVYLDGNSLGRLPLATAGRIKEAVEQEWGRRLIRSWNEGWMEASVRLGGKVASLIGAGADEVIMTDATSVNLFKLAVAALKAQPGRSRIVSDELNFPSDLYILQGVIDLLGGRHDLHLASSKDDVSIEPSAVEALLDDHTALLCLTHTCFKSAFMHDMARLTRSAHRHGALVLWDLSHSAGAVEVYLAGCGADLAVGCTYKYLNGGPGAPAFLYVRKDLQEKLLQPVWGWLGAADPFAFDPSYQPAGDMRRFQVGSPPILSLLAVEPGLDLLLEAGIDRLRKKSMAQTEYLIYLFDQWLAPLGFALASPRDPASRGSHVAIRHPEAFRICRALIEAGPPDIKVIPDFRAPDSIRLGIAPVYTSFEDIQRALARIKEVVEKRRYELYSGDRQTVT